jgi:hypothetical protein
MAHETMGFFNTQPLYNLLNNLLRSISFLTRLFRFVCHLNEKLQFDICFSNSGNSPAGLRGIKRFYLETCASGAKGL